METRTDMFWRALSSSTTELLLKMRRDRHMHVVDAWDSIVDPETFQQGDGRHIRYHASHQLRSDNSYSEFVRTQLPTFKLSEAMQEAVSAHLKTDLFEQVFRENATQPAALSRSYAQLAEFEAASTRTTRVPDAVLKALEASVDDDDSPGAED